MRLFLKKLLYTVFPLWLLTLGLVSYLSLYIAPKATGDIGRLSFIPFGEDYNQKFESEFIKDTLFASVYDVDKLRCVKADVLTIGDSFSARKREGYQNYLSRLGLNVVNCDRVMYSDQFQFAYNILKLGYVDSTNIKNLIIECAERGVISHLLAFKENANSMASKETSNVENTNKSAANVWSLSRTRDFILYRMGIVMPIHRASLDGEFFSCSYSDKLFFLDADLKGIKLTESNKRQMKKNYEIVAHAAKNRHINLILMIAVDKYDLYQNKIIDNKFPCKTINEDLREIFKDNEHLMITKDYLLPYVDRGEKDVFWANDTHWSYKGAEIVAKGLLDYIKR